jgi:hypothetical protein
MKSVGFAPTVATASAMGELPVFVTVTVTAALGLPTVCEEKFTLVGATEMPVVPPFPLSATD